MRITILGDGAWGTTLAILLSKKGYQIFLWGPFPDYLDILNKKKENIKYLPGIKIPKEIIFEKNLKKAYSSSKLIIIAIPTKFFRKIVKKLKPFPKKGKIFVSVAKGIEEKSLKRPSEILREELGKVRIAVLTGPNIAREVAKEMPSVSLVASLSPKIAKSVQKIFFSPYFRTYWSKDVIGAELGGALKNVIAIASGIADGLGLGINSKSALIVRGIAEIQRLAKKFGAKKKTINGIAGLGDLILTSFSPLSRNRTLGENLGKGKSLKEILELSKDFSQKIRGIVEGITTVKAVKKLAQNLKVEMPISEGVYKILYSKKDPKEILKNLMQRPKKRE